MPRTSKPPNDTVLNGIKSDLIYDPHTGIVFDKVKNKKWTNTTDQGYVYVWIKYKRLSAHSIAWYLMTGHYPLFPNEQIDHINRIRDDNRWENLRLVTEKQNKANSFTGKNNFKGIRRIANGRKWEAKKDYVDSNGKRNHTVFGYFNNPKEAAACYNENIYKLDGDFAYINKIPQFITKAIVLAGGSGNRLKPITNTMNKQIIPIANIPTCHHIIKKIIDSGIFEIGIILSPHNGEAVKESILKSFTNIKFTFIYQQKPLGIAHALSLCKNFIQDDSFFLCLGDNIVDVSLRELRKELMYINHACLLLKEVADPSRYGVVYLSSDKNKIIRLEEKPQNPKSNLIATGIYLFRPNIFKYIENLQPSSRGELEIVDAVQKLIDDNKLVSYKLLKSWYLDTGKKDTLLEANRTILAENKLEQKIDSSSTILNCKIVGPVIIGKNCHIENCYIGPYTSIGDNCILKNIKIQDSILIGNSKIQNISKLIIETVIGESATIEESGNNSIELMIGDNSHVIF